MGKISQLKRGQRLFRGVAQLSLDNKGRLAIPTKYREGLATRGNGRLVITADPDACLLLYAQPDWEPIQQKLNSLSSFNPKLRNLQRVIVGYAEDIEMDGTGRILISPSLREFAALDKRVVLVGQGMKFELWDAKKWNEQRNLAQSFRNQPLPPELEGFSL